jgi:hypothetical protein
LHDLGNFERGSLDSELGQDLRRIGEPAKTNWRKPGSQAFISPTFGASVSSMARPQIFLGLGRKAQSGSGDGRVFCGS